VHQAVKQIGALTAVLGGIDALVFTGGIGENSSIIRQRICQPFSWLGIALDGEANGRKESCISSTQSKVSVWVIPTDEELMIARHITSLLDFPVST
jgi:acetate kinase